MQNYRVAFILAIGIAIEMMATAVAGQVRAGHQFTKDVHAMKACHEILQPTRTLRIIVRPGPKARGQISV